MNQNNRNRQFPASNPLANLLVIVVGALTIAVSVVVGVVAFFALMGVVLCFAAVLGVRVWWINRRIRAGSRQSTNPQGRGVPASQTVSQTIEGEYRVVTVEKSKTPDN